MAAEMQISDILCEAMEYLYKLGSNLRTRSENLKEKRISKNKLKNTHAVQKAASKVLLICELSKKSLDNVESGVRSVLSMIDASQGSSTVDGKSYTTRQQKYHYFEYSSQKLRIAQKIQLNHYMSVKVLASRMPTSIHENYPVYYDCKLKRQRRRENHHKLEMQIKTSHNLSDTNKGNEKSEFNNEGLGESQDDDETDKEALKNKSYGRSETRSESDNELHCPNKLVKYALDISVEKVSDRSKDNIDCDHPSINSHRVDDNSVLEVDNKMSPEVLINDGSGVNGNEQELCKNKLIPTDSDTGFEVPFESDVTQTNNKSTIDIEKNCESESDPTTTIIDNNSRGESKPLIRCVNLSKLLKPSVLTEKHLSSNNTESFKKKELQLSKNYTVIKKRHKHDKTLKNKQTVYDECLMQKRKEVAEFKAKEFSIKMLRLPDLTKSFLLVHNLKKITKRGDVICEILDADASNSKKIKDVKNALLNDSESDECSGVNSVKKSLLKDSDSETGTRNIDNPRGSFASSDKEAKQLENTEDDSTAVMNTNHSKIVSTRECEKKLESSTSIEERERNTDCENDSSRNVTESDIHTHPETPTKCNNNIKLSLLKDSSDEKLDKNIEETPTKTNARLKSSLLNDSSAEESTVLNNAEMETPTKTNAKMKSSLLGDSSDVKSDSADDKKEKRKTPKSKLKRIRESREARMKLHYNTSSDSDQEIHKHKRTRLRSHKSSSSSEDNIKNRKKMQISDSNDADNGKTKSNAQVDGADNLQSFSSANKMVRSKAKPSGSSSQISDNQDPSDKDIDGLTNLNSLNKNRSCETSSKDIGAKSTRKSSDNDSVAKIKISLSKSKAILGEELLKAEESDESSSNASNIGESDFGEELPVVTMPVVNGDSDVDHLAKDDLLGETESSYKSHSENTDNMDDTDDGAKIKSKRRKPLALSSDSEGGSTRKKRDVDKISDFEDSEEDTSETGKKVKRKKNISDSDASLDSNDAGQKKRRRIKQLKDSDVSDSDSENEGRNKHGRKNIRKVKGKNQLEEATKKAAREEKERIARITERQKMYNNLDFDESGKPDEVVLDKVVLDFDPETKEPLIQVDRGLVKKLKPHQANGIKFMWDACFESVKRIKKAKGSGCILAHCMGLGKTLQVISLAHTLLTHSDLTGVNRVLVVCPLSTVLNWVNEFNMWLEHAETEFAVDVYELSRFKQNSERAYQLLQWFEGGGVCVLGYEMFRNLSADNPKKFKKKMLKSFQESLVDPGPDLVICDEGHLLKNEKTSLSQSMNRVKTARRIVLTGTPLQNNLKEYYCMVQFVKPNLLGKYNEYLNRFVNPITNGQYTDSTEHDIRIMKRRSHVLHKMLDGAVQRRDYGVLAPFLPPKHEYVLFITLSDVQIKLYEHYLEHYSRKPMSGRTGFLFPDFQSLQRIWTHPLVLKYNSERYEIMQQKKREREEEEESDGSRGSLDEFIDDDSTPEESSTEESSDELSEASDDSRKKKKKKSSKKKETKTSTRRGTRANPVAVEDLNKSDEVVETKNDNPTEWWIKLVEEEELDDMRNSHKLVLLFDILRQCENIGDKLLVFSQSLYSLDLIEHFLQKVDEATQEGRIDEKLGGHVGSWSQGVDYFRLDGSTSCENRSIWCKNFNAVDNPRARLFLISTRAGGLGINLVAANRVVIFDVSWNPSHDVQSIFRVYRFGQKKPCYVYRFLAMGTMEEKIYERQVTKQAISKRVIDEQQIDRHYAENDLAELYKFEARPLEPRPTPPLPKDRLFAEILKEHEHQIYKYHEHDSLLENKEEETLSEEERKAAWEDFENEKTRPPPAPFGPSPWAMHNGLLAQQQMAYTALVNFLRNDIPNINDNQIRELLSSGVLNGPNMSQKMSEVYKYSMPGMMNPALMNSMNTGGVSGSSGLQYEPPWQRQQQQQQQLRLQQMMQHQNPMGAKLYAGGLGSRDPVAMALQQQRAREIMMGGGGGGGAGPLAARPRGRPPAHTRMPTSSQDVVNLDSD